MNAERLYDLLKLLSDQEETHKPQELVDQIYQQIQQLAGNPQDTGVQTQLASTVSALADGLGNIEGTLTPADHERIRELGGDEFYSRSLLTTITSTLQQNAMTPAAAVATIRVVQRQRTEFLNRMRETISGLSFFGFDSEFLEGEEKAPYLGFQIPREIFENELSGFSKEVKVLDSIARWFSECATGSVETPKLKSLSTSDPTVALTISPATIVAIGAAITWLLNTWKQVLEIKELHQNAKNLGFTERDLSVFEKRIEEVVSSSIKKHSSEVVKGCKADAGRKNEIRSGIEWSMRALLQRIERGMTVEVKFLPPGVTNDESSASESEDQNRMKLIADELVFPTPKGDPLLALTTEVDPDPPQDE